MDSGISCEIILNNLSLVAFALKRVVINIILCLKCDDNTKIIKNKLAIRCLGAKLFFQILKIEIKVIAKKL